VIKEIVLKMRGPRKMTNQDVIGDNMLTDGVGVDKFMCDKNSDVITAFNEAEVA
jgi:hypothetical protein